MIHLKQQNIRTSLAVTMGLFAVLTIIALGWIQYYSVSRAIIKDVYEKQLITILKAHQSQLQALLEKAIETSEILADDPLFLEWFGSEKVNVDVKDLALQKLDKLQHDFGYPTVFAVCYRTHEYWQENYNLLDIVSEDDPDDSWFFETMKLKKVSTLNFDYNNEMKKSILFVNALMGDTINPIGVAGVGIDPSVLIEHFKKNKISPNSSLWLIDNKGKVIMSENVEEINLSFNSILDSLTVFNIIHSPQPTNTQDLYFRSNKAKAATMQIGSTGYKVVMVVPEKDLLSILNVISYNTLWLSIIILILTLIVATILANRISTPIIRLTKLSNALARQHLDLKVDHDLIERDDEIGQLAQAFDVMQKKLTVIIERLNTTNKSLQQEKLQLKETNKQLEVALDKASESERLTKAFLANISHEVRTPMNSIMGFAQLLAEDEKSDTTTVKEYTQIIILNSQQLLAILNNIIDVSKMDSGLMKPKLGTVSARKVITDTYTLFTFASGKKISLINKSEEEKDDVLFTSDELMIRQVLNNLLSNAIKYTQEGTIEIGFKLKQKAIVFYVADTGMGIPDKDKESIFKPFWQVDRPDSSIHEGAGLGLAISKKIANMLNGQISVNSVIGVGSVFYLELPKYVATNLSKE